MYANGEGVAQNDQMAYVWSSLASTSSNSQVRDAAIKLKDLLAKLMKPEQIEAAKQTAQNIYNKYAVLTK